MRAAIGENYAVTSKVIAALTKSEAHTITGSKNKMARTIRTKVYKFNELNEDAKQKVIERLYDINVNDYDWHRFVLEEQEERLTELGFINPKIMYSGFASQGDGACFTCDNVDFRVFMNGKYKEFATALYCSITHNYRYYFSTSTTVNLDIEDSITNEDAEEIEKAVINEREKLGNEIYRILEKEYEYQTSKESIIATIEANEYEFTKDGNRFI